MRPVTDSVQKNNPLDYCNGQVSHRLKLGFMVDFQCRVNPTVIMIEYLTRDCSVKSLTTRCKSRQVQPEFLIRPNRLSLNRAHACSRLERSPDLPDCLSTEKNHSGSISKLNLNRKPHEEKVAVLIVVPGDLDRGRDIQIRFDGDLIEIRNTQSGPDHF